MRLDQTKLQKIEFGDQPEDIFYCLVDLQTSPGGMDIGKIKLTDPRRLDMEFRNHGCLMMFTGDEIEELIRRGDLDKNNLHRTLYELAVKEGVVRRS